MVAGEEGKGQFTYVGYRFFEEYCKQNLPVMGQVFTHLVAPYYEPAVWVEAPTVVEAIYNRKGSELRVSLVNGITGSSLGRANEGKDSGTRVHQYCGSDSRAGYKDSAPWQEGSTGN